METRHGPTHTTNTNTTAPTHKNIRIRPTPTCSVDPVQLQDTVSNWFSTTGHSVEDGSQLKAIVYSGRPKFSVRQKYGAYNFGY